MTKAIGVDVSKYNVSTNGTTLWDYTKRKKQIDFVIQRASYGGSLGGQVKDEMFDLLYPSVLKCPIRGAYHYYSSHSPWKQQADFFLSITKDKAYHFLAVDYETAYNTLDKRTIAEFAEFVKYLKAQTGKRVLAYFNWNVFTTFIKPYGYDAWVNNEDVWYAWYPYQNTEDPPTSVARPIGMGNYRIHQYGAGDVANTAGYTAGANYGGGSRGIDLNAYNGTVDDMKQWLGISESIPKPELSDAEKLAKLWDAHKELW